MTFRGECTKILRESGMIVNYNINMNYHSLPIRIMNEINCFFPRIALSDSVLDVKSSSTSGVISDKQALLPLVSTNCNVEIVCNVAIDELTPQQNEKLVKCCMQGLKFI